MAISYASNVFSFVDSQYGTAAAGGTGVKVQVPVIVDLITTPFFTCGESTYRREGRKCGFVSPSNFI